MQPDPKSARDGPAASPDQRLDARAELDRLRATCDDQARDIARLRDALTAMSALVADSAGLRAHDRPHVGDAAARRWETRIPLDLEAPAVARAAATDVLAERVPAAVLHDALMLVSELASNSVRHSGVGPGGELVLQVRLRDGDVRIDVEDAGVSGLFALSEPSPDGSGLGLHILQALSEAWGLERDAAEGTRVWGQIAIPAIASRVVATAGQTPEAVDGALDWRPLTADDLPLLVAWFAEPQVARWWHHEATAQAVARDFGASVRGEEPGEDLVVLLDGCPIGLLQRSRIADYPEDLAEFSAVVTVPDGAIELDYMIADPALRGRGLGSRMIARAVAETWVLHPEAPAILVAVVSANVASWRALEKAGLERVAEGGMTPENPVDDRAHFVYRALRP